MSISVDCQNCGKTLKAKDSAAGKTAKCPDCGEMIRIPELDLVLDAEEDFGSSQAAEDDLPLSTGGDQKPCPMCGEMIASSAKKCRFCGEYLDETLKKKKKKQSSSGDEEMTTVDWILCILCPGIGCIVGIVRAIQGNSTGGKMIGISIGMAIIWNVLNVFLQAIVQNN
jgi:predicted RNA-binding Zn-ribbon protein involved in translation (DUF1610 family)